MSENTMLYSQERHAKGKLCKKLGSVDGNYSTGRARPLISHIPSKATTFPGGGGGHSTYQVDRGVPLGGPEPDPVILRSAHEKSTLSYCTLLKTFKCIPCCNIAHLGYTLSVSVWLGALSWQGKKKKKKKKGPRLRLNRGPVILHYGYVTLW